ncbi:hypothetical protein IE53DRAFT_145798 [Violaceomyces palustris]|uniref:Uncharacterized protein n=1 Tax=Violaceomyces palustris TaxID=1673888 RepID=A0ACD0P6A1_9BASI|nr:hypothetical protein IE53DRAFT_145798 [Violaceomyces palustris]
MQDLFISKLGLSQPSLHPTLSVSINLGPSRIPPSTACRPRLLLNLPPNLFYDPFTSHSIQSDPSISDVCLLGPLELERAVGWSRTDGSAIAKGSFGAHCQSYHDQEEPHERDQNRGSGKARDQWDNHIRPSGSKDDIPPNALTGATLLFDQENPLPSPLEHTLKPEHTSVIFGLSADHLSDLGEQGTTTFQVDVPLHARYLPPIAPPSRHINTAGMGIFEVVKELLRRPSTERIKRPLHGYRNREGSDASFDQDRVTDRLEKERTGEEQGSYLKVRLKMPTLFLECEGSPPYPSLEGWEETSQICSRRPTPIYSCRETKR